MVVPLTLEAERNFSRCPLPPHSTARHDPNRYIFSRLNMHHSRARKSRRPSPRTQHPFQRCSAVDHLSAPVLGSAGPTGDCQLWRASTVCSVQRTFFYVWLHNLRCCRVCYGVVLCQYSMLYCFHIILYYTLLCSQMNWSVAYLWTCTIWCGTILFWYIWYDTVF